MNEKLNGVMDGTYPHVVLPLKEMGHEVILFDIFTRESKDLIKLCEEWGPDLLFCCLAEDQISYDDIEWITKNTDTTTYNWFWDTIWRFDTFDKKYCKAFDYCSITEHNYIDEFKKIGYNNIFTTCGFCNDKIFYPESVCKIYDVSFIGRVHGGRLEYIDYLIKNNINVKVFSNIQTFWEMNRIYNQSKIVLAFSMSSDKIHKQDKGRFYETTASGACMFTDYDFDSNNQSYRSFVDAIIFNNKEDLLNKIKFYLSNDVSRMEIANSGYNRFKQMHTSKIRFNQIFEKVGLIK